MVKLTNCKTVKHNYQITFTLDDGSTKELLVSEDLLVEHRLLKDKVFDEPAFRSFLRIASVDHIYQGLVKRLSLHPRTVAETEKILAEKELGETEQRLVLERLKKAGWLDDERFVENYLDYHMSVRHEGPAKLRFALHLKGIGDTQINRHLSRYDEAFLLENMNLMMDKYLAKPQNHPKDRAKQLLAQKLIASGFEPDKVFSFVKSKAALFENPEADLRLLEHDLRKALRKYPESTTLPRETKTKIVRSLMAKGYAYGNIMKMIEGGFNGEQ